MPYSITNFHPGNEKLPSHVGLIPDGTGRWAVINNISLYQAYIQAMKKLAGISNLFLENGSQAISLYLASAYNLRRSDNDILDFCKAEDVFCNDLLPDIVQKYNTSVKIAGNIQSLPEFFQQSLLHIQSVTHDNDSTRLYLCVAYNPLEELIQAFQSAESPERFIEKLWVPEPIDLLIRTGGANVLSHFLPLQVAYARFYVLDKLFMETEIDDYQDVLNQFEKLERSYGN